MTLLHVCWTLKVSLLKDSAGMFHLMVSLFIFLFPVTRSGRSCKAVCPPARPSVRTNVRLKYPIRQNWCACIFIPPLQRSRGILFYRCSSARPSHFFVTFFSATINRTLLIFCIRLHIGMMYLWMHFEIHPTSSSCLQREKLGEKYRKMVLLPFLM